MILYRIYSKLVELAKLETQQPDRKMFKRALETEHSVSQENLNQEEKTTKSPTRKYSRLAEILLLVLAIHVILS